MKKLILLMLALSVSVFAQTETERKMREIEKRQKEIEYKQRTAERNARNNNSNEPKAVLSIDQKAFEEFFKKGESASGKKRVTTSRKYAYSAGPYKYKSVAQAREWAITKWVKMSAKQQAPYYKKARYSR